MPHYFFHTEDGDQDLDREGQDFPDDEAAKVAGVKYAGSMLNDQPGIVQPGRPFRVNVVDRSQRRVAAVVASLELTDPPA